MHRRWHPCNAFALASTPHPFRVLPPHVYPGAIVEIPGQVDRRIGYSSWCDERLVDVVSPVSLPLSCFESRRSRQAEWRCIEKELFREEPRAMRGGEVTANPSVAPPTF